MACVFCKAKVPGSLMLFGEHAVLQQKQAVVVAINQYVTVNLIPQADRNIHIVSQAFGNSVVALDRFKIVKPYDYVLTAIKQYLPKIKTGFTLKISSDFSSKIGFGSSAAVTVATIGVLHRWLAKKKPSLMQFYRQAIAVVRQVQGFGSGADVAASVFGGVIAYKMKPLAIKKLPKNLFLVAVYSGSKVATREVVAQVERRRKKFPSIFANLYQVMDCCAKEGIVAIKNNQPLRLGQLMNINQGLQEALGVSNAILAELILSLRNYATIFGAKISGSGLGDCVIGLGKIKKNSFPKNSIQKQLGVKQIDIEVSSKGLVWY